MTYPDGEQYVGEFRDNDYNGHGTLTLRDGRKCVGKFTDGKFHGEGTEYRADGSIRQSGIWENGVFIKGQ